MNLSAFITILCLSLMTCQVYAATPVAQAIWVKGTVTATQPGQSPRVLERRSVLFAHDVIASAKTGSGELSFTDGSILSLNPDSQLQINQYSFTPDSTATDECIMTLIKGGLRTITGTIPKENPDGYIMKTPVATIGVRGTEYILALSANNHLAVKIEKGTIIIKNQAGQVNLNACNGMACNAFSVIKNINEMPHPIANQPPELMHVAPITQIPTGWGAPGKPGAPGTPPVPTLKPSNNPKLPAPKTVSGFCVGLLELVIDFYKHLA